MDTLNTNHQCDDLSPEIKEEIRKDILSMLFDENSTLSTKVDADLLRMVLVENRKLSEIANELNLSLLQVTQLFYRALGRVSIRYANFNTQIENAIDLQGEILLLRGKLLRYERKENNVHSLPYETKKILFQRISDIGFSKRVWNILNAHEIEIVADLVRITKRTFSTWRLVGEGCIKEVNDFLLSKGLRWGMDV